MGYKPDRVYPPHRERCYALYEKLILDDVFREYLFWKGLRCVNSEGDHFTLFCSTVDEYLKGEPTLHLDKRALWYGEYFQKWPSTSRMPRTTTIAGKKIDCESGHGIKPQSL